MTFFRKIRRLILLFFWFFRAMLHALPGYFQRPEWESVRRGTSSAKFWARGILKILNVNLIQEGERELPEGVLVVSNHMGYLDIVVHAALTGVRFSPKAEIRKWPVLGAYIKLSRPVWVDRKSKIKSEKTMREYRETLEHGISMIVYPEGTSTDGLHGLLPFKSTPFEAAIQSGADILPILTSYEIPEGTMNPAWFGDQSLLPHIWQLLGIPRITARITVLPPVRAKEKATRKELAAHTETIMNIAYTKQKERIDKK